MRMESENTTCVKLEKSSLSDLLMSTYILTFVFGLIFNVATFIPIVKQVKQQNVLGVFLLCLSFSDFLFIATLPLWINYYYNDHNWTLPSWSCRIIGFIYYSNMYISIYLLCCISVDRFLVVCYPLRFTGHRTTFYAWIQAGIVCAVVMGLHIIMLAAEEVKDPAATTCYETYPMEANVAKFNLIRMGLGFVLPLLILVISYWRILTTVDQRARLNAQARRKVHLISYGVIIIFSICFAPYHILLFIRSVVYLSSNDASPEGTYCEFENSMHFYFSCTLALSSLNSVMDPVLYALATKGIPKKIQQFCNRCGCEQTVNSAMPAANENKFVVTYEK